MGVGVSKIDRPQVSKDLAMPLNPCSLSKKGIIVPSPEALPQVSNCSSAERGRNWELLLSGSTCSHPGKWLKQDHSAATAASWPFLQSRLGGIVQGLEQEHRKIRKKFTLTTEVSKTLLQALLQLNLKVCSPCAYMVRCKRCPAKEALSHPILCAKEPCEEGWADRE